MKYDIIIPTIFRDYFFLKKVVRYICDNLSPENIYIITNYRKSKYLPSEILNNPLCTIVDENNLLPGLSYEIVSKILKAHHAVNPNTGWYFQQLIKIGFAISPYSHNNYYLSWDSDTLPIRPIPMFDKNGHPYFTMKDEYHKPYFHSTYRLLGIKKVNKKSYIAEHMLFNREIVHELITEIDNSDVIGSTWFEKIINSTDCKEQQGFSEFETYGSFCKVRHPSLYRERELPSIRHAGYIQGRFVSEKIIKELGSDMYIASFEVYHKPPFPWSFISNIYYKYIKKKERLIDKILQFK